MMGSESQDLIRPGVDDAFGSMPRLKVTAFLAGCDEAEFKVIAAATNTAPSALSKAATNLEDLGYVTVKRGHVGRRSRTWLALTPSGRSAFENHLLALEQLTELGRTAAEG